MSGPYFKLTSRGIAEIAGIILKDEASLEENTI
jgi:hypothetical protein